MHKHCYQAIVLKLVAQGHSQIPLCQLGQMEKQGEVKQFVVLFPTSFPFKSGQQRAKLIKGLIQLCISWKLQNQRQFCDLFFYIQLYNKENSSLLPSFLSFVSQHYFFCFSSSTQVGIPLEFELFSLLANAAKKDVLVCSFTVLNMNKRFSN